MSMHASIAPDMAQWLGAVSSLGDGDECEWGTLADLMHSLDLSVYSRLAIGRHIRTEYMLPPEEISQRFAVGLTRLQGAGQYDDSAGNVTNFPGRAGHPHDVPRTMGRHDPVGAMA